jgi:hypothetical protein
MNDYSPWRKLQERWRRMALCQGTICPSRSVDWFAVVASPGDPNCNVRGE